MKRRNREAASAASPASASVARRPPALPVPTPGASTARNSFRSGIRFHLELSTVIGSSATILGPSPWEARLAPQHHTPPPRDAHRISGGNCALPTLTRHAPGRGPAPWTAGSRSHGASTRYPSPRNAAKSSACGRVHALNAREPVTPRRGRPSPPGARRSPGVRPRSSSGSDRAGPGIEPRNNANRPVGRLGLLGFHLHREAQSIKTGHHVLRVFAPERAGQRDRSVRERGEDERPIRDALRSRYRDRHHRGRCRHDFDEFGKWHRGRRSFCNRSPAHGPRTAAPVVASLLGRPEKTFDRGGVVVLDRRPHLRKRGTEPVERGDSASRLASACHAISGDPEATRVVSRKPVAHNWACSGA
jgi:hypothetical protein